MEWWEFDTRVAAYAVIVDDSRILLSWYNGEGRGTSGWSLPGGGVEFGESLEEAVVREVGEETGYEVEVGALLATHAFSAPRSLATGRPYQSVRIIFGAAIVGGELGTLEVGGTTDRAEWLPLDDPALSHPSTADIVGVALDAWRAGR